MCQSEAYSSIVHKSTIKVDSSSSYMYLLVQLNRLASVPRTNRHQSSQPPSVDYGKLCNVTFCPEPQDSASFLWGYASSLSSPLTEVDFSHIKHTHRER